VRVKTLAGLAAALTLAIAAGAAARSSGVSAVEGDVKAAIKAEKQALKDLEAGRLGKVKDGLEQSRSALQRAQGATSGITRGDVRQALTKDGIALENLNNPRARDRVRLKINEAIVRKESALEYFDHHTALPPPNRPPRVPEFKAEFPTGPKLTTTTYTVTASDPDGDKLTYTWTKRQPDKACGVFTPAGRVATWDHPGEQQGGDCPHEEDFHEGTITVVVSDGKASCTVVDQNGSKPVPPFDPGEDCSRTGKPSLTPGQAAALGRAVVTAMNFEDEALDLLSSKKKRKRKKAAQLAGLAAAALNRIEASLAGLEGASAIEKLVHEASALDEEASAEITAGDRDAATTKLRLALGNKEAADEKLKAIAKK
jgi:hypothetical protein